MAGALLVVIVAVVVPLLPEAATKPLFFFYGDSYEDLLTDYIEYSNEDSGEYGDDKEEPPPSAGGGGIINNGVVVTINGVPFNCTQKPCVLNTNHGNGTPSSEVTTSSQETTLPSNSDAKETASEAETTKTTLVEENGKVSTEGAATEKPTEETATTAKQAVSTTEA